MPLPAWLDALYAAAEMRAVDAWAVERQGVPSHRLMERAGEGLARVTAAAARPAPIRVVVGKGNNGGDGLVAARLLRAEGHEVDVLAAAPSTSCGATRGQPRAPARRAARAVRPRSGSAGSGAVVDACSAPASRARRARRRGGDRRRERAGRARRGLRRALGRRRRLRRGGGRGRAGRASRPPSTGRRSACGSRRAPARGARGGRAHRRAARGPGAAEAGLISPRVLELFPRRARTAPSSRRGSCSSPVAHAGSPGRPRWPRAQRSAPARATCRSPCRARPSPRSTCACSRP